MEGNPASDNNLIPGGQTQSFAYLDSLGSFQVHQGLDDQQFYQQGSQFQDVLPFGSENMKEIEKPSDDNWNNFDKQGGGDGCYDGSEGRGEFLWQRVKWTPQMVRLLINAVCYVDEDASSDCLGGVRRKSSIVHKIGKWKCVSKLMIERGHHVSPQQCEDKFNDLNKRYKRLNDVLGKGICCKVVENPELLDIMNVYNKHSLQLILGSREDDEPNQSRQHNGDDEFEKEQQDAAPDGGFEGIEDNKGTSRFPEPSSKRCKQMNEMKDVVVGNPSNSVEYGKMLEASKQNDQLDLSHVNPNYNSSYALQEQWMAFRLLELRRQKIQIQARKLALEKQQFKWRRINWNKDRDLDKIRLENECMKLVNERLASQLGTRK
ncbi:hypothetical protein F3Y22_tig00117048pilonHSYRG00097 [Hibiscus syriacus]|uniref:Myb/SANT-like DNA-binding domain-containing protein n=1 Tax=Hibiscus syriacus TaxID=106335 RepID=A0A6A2XCF5_HIBSY|nr:hypothetical protein F3Y22_tig00117048pilonHSYRG00097 [Hibiscus syriacus]